MPVIKKNDTYEIFFYCTHLPDSSMPDLMAFEVLYKGGTEKISITPKEKKGSWVSLGTFTFEKGEAVAITIDGSQSKGALFSDAILLVPKK